MDSEPTLFSDPVFNAVMLAAAILLSAVAACVHRRAGTGKKKE